MLYTNNKELGSEVFEEYGRKYFRLQLSPH